MSRNLTVYLPLPQPNPAHPGQDTPLVVRCLNYVRVCPVVPQDPEASFFLALGADRDPDWVTFNREAHPYVLRGDPPAVNVIFRVPGRPALCHMSESDFDPQRRVFRLARSREGGIAPLLRIEVPRGCSTVQMLGENGAYLDYHVLERRQSDCPNKTMIEAWADLRPGQALAARAIREDGQTFLRTFYYEGGGQLVISPTRTSTGGVHINAATGLVTPFGGSAQETTACLGLAGC